MTDRQLCQQRREAEVVELRAQLCALDDVLEDVGLRRETRECADQSLDRQRREAGAARQRGVERLQVAFSLIPLRLHVGKAERDLGCTDAVDQVLPLRALVLDPRQRAVHVGHVHAGTHELA